MEVPLVLMEVQEAEVYPEKELKVSFHDMGKGVSCGVVLSRFQIKVPYDERFVMFAHSVGARWRRRSGIWSFERHDYPAVAKKCNQLFGTRFVIKTPPEV